MIRIAIVEDNESAAKELRRYIERCAEERDFSDLSAAGYSVNTYDSGEVFLAESAEKGFDIVFMDIGLPDRDGMSIAEELRKNDETAIIIFVTDMAQFAVRGYKVDALDYIVKPVTFYNFRITLKRAVSRLARKVAPLTVRTANGIVRISPDDLRYVEVLNHTVFYHTGSEPIRANGQLKDIESELVGLGFIKVSRYCLVNVRYIRSVEDFSVNVDGTSLQISVRKRREVMLRIAELFG